VFFNLPNYFAEVKCLVCEALKCQESVNKKIFSPFLLLGIQIMNRKDGV